MDAAIATTVFAAAAAGVATATPILKDAGNEKTFIQKVGMLPVIPLDADDWTGDPSVDWNLALFRTAAMVVIFGMAIGLMATVIFMLKRAAPCNGRDAAGGFFAMNVAGKGIAYGKGLPNAIAGKICLGGSRSATAIELVSSLLVENEKLANGMKQMTCNGKPTADSAQE